ncbi:hypothetical protein ACQW5G_07805 [Fructilactobacillus sp. Tb1]|uniref:hypothetical protein n=1 Tax=Fructilactobacillus sp. Tb1 TaxID=3422304 RepID=UPI003D2C67C2
MDLKAFHDYVKKNYENSQYDNEYSKFHDYNSNTDFNLGVKQAKDDFYSNKHFKIYPLYLIKLTNKLFNNRLYEIVDFISGYNYEKRKLK